jgi:hypothetical protein
VALTRSNDETSEQADNGERGEDGLGINQNNEAKGCLFERPSRSGCKPIFRENDTDETVLPTLTHEILKELGVASFDHHV